MGAAGVRRGARPRRHRRGGAGLGRRRHQRDDLPEHRRGTCDRRREHRRRGLPRRAGRRCHVRGGQARVGQPDRRAVRRPEVVGRAHHRRAGHQRRRLGEVGARREPQAGVRRPQADPSTRLGVAFVLREAFTKAQHYRAARAAAEAKGEPFAVDLTLDTLARVLDGELVWDQHTHRHDDIATAVRLSEEFGYRLVVNHGTEAHKIADVLAEKQIPVIFGPMLTSRSKVELRDRAIVNLATLAAAGVRVAITTDHPVVPINLLVLQAVLAVRDGLPRQTALEALTVNPASFLGLDERIGALTPGRDGDVVIWSDDPLTTDARVEHVLIEGRTVYTWDAAERRGHVVERAERFAR
ncbi:amidohydrolase family protein [Cellulomonas soli]